MIVELSSDLESFKTLRFGRGLNILLSERHESSGARDSRNGTGKTSFIELLHFLVSDKRSNIDDFHKPSLLGAEYFCKFSENGEVFTVSRKTGPTDQPSLEGEPIAAGDLRAKLAVDWFGLSEQDTGEKYSPKFSALLSYFMRKERNGGFSSPILNASAQVSWDSQVCLSYLLGFDWRLPQKLQIKKDQKKETDALHKMIKNGLLSNGELDLNKMQARLDYLDSQVIEKRQEIASTAVVDGYRQHETTANSLTVNIRELNEANLADLDLIENIDEALSEVNDAQFSDVESLYHQVGVFFSDQVKKRFEEVAIFHSQVARNRESHLKREKKNAQDRLDSRKLEINKIQAILSEQLGILKSGIAIERLTFLQSELNRM